MLCRRASVARFCELSLISVRGERCRAPLGAVAKSARPLSAFGSLGSANTAVAIHSADAGSIRNKPGARTLTRLTEERDMPVVRLLQNLKVTPEESARLVTAYEETLKAFCVSWTEAILLRSWWQQRSSKSANGAFLIRPRSRDSPSRNWEAPSNRRGRSPPRGACDDRLRPELARCSLNLERGRQRAEQTQHAVSNKERP